MKQIPLKQGIYAIVDDEDYPRLAKHKWNLSGAKPKYAVRTHYFREIPLFQIERISAHLIMHRIVMGLYNDDKREVHHLNNNSLDNRKQNLLICNRSKHMRIDQRSSHPHIKKQLLDSYVVI